MEELKDIKVELEPDILEAQDKEKLIYGPGHRWWLHPARIVVLLYSISTGKRV